MTRSLRTLALPAAAASVLALSACGGSTTTGSHDMGSMSQPSTTTNSGSTGSSTPAAGQHNDADVAFATEMIPHHAQAIHMGDMAAERARSPQVKILAAQIKAAQGPEIATMSGWLKDWGKPVPNAMGGHNMGSMGHSMNGMMSNQEMGALGKATGTAFDRMWLTGMVKHHQGAVTMARTELAHGASADAKKLAQAIIDSQNKEITQMKTMLAAMKG
jgi:uncharacterized protein (DUF305 family)